MDAPQTNPTLVHNPKSHTSALVILAVVITLIIAGGGVYAWQYLISQEKDGQIQRLEQQVEGLNTEVNQLQTEKESLDEQIAQTESKNNQVTGIGAVLDTYRVPFSIAGENHQLMPTDNWSVYNNENYQYSFRFDNTVFNCEQDPFVRPFDPDNNKLPEGETTDLGKIMENEVSCVAIEPCTINFLGGCAPAQIRIGIYPNVDNLTLNEFCEEVFNVGDNNCAEINYEISGLSAIRNSSRAIPVDQPPQAEEDIYDVIHFSRGDKNYTISSITGYNGQEGFTGRTYIETMLNSFNFN